MYSVCLQSQRIKMSRSFQINCCGLVGFQKTSNSSFICLFRDFHLIDCDMTLYFTKHEVPSTKDVCTKFDLNLPSGSREDKNLKSWISQKSHILVISQML